MSKNAHIPPGYYQDIVLKFDDGSIIKAVVEAFCGFDDKPAPILTGVEVYKPVKIPEALIAAFSDPHEGGNKP